MSLLALRTENYFFNAKSLNLTASKNINFYFQIRMFWLSPQNTPTLDTVYGPIKKMKTVLERSDLVLSNVLLTYVKCSLFFHMNTPI